MRDVGLVGQVLVMGMALFVGIGFEAWAVGGVIALTAASNVALRGGVRWWPRTAERMLPGVVLFDLGAFSVLMFLTGGSGNPLCTLYMVHVAMGVALLPLTWAAGVTVVTAAAYGLMFKWRREVDVPAAWAGAEDAARWVSLALAAVLIAYFIWLVKSALLERDRRVTRLQRVEVDNARLASLTTLAAGAAHELGSPLGTIALASKEVARSARLRDDAETAEDAELIRSEVDRCRDILDRLRSEEMAAWLTQEPTWVAAAELERGLRAALGPASDRLAVNVEPGAERVRLMTQAVVQVLLILVRNAIDASGPDDPIVLNVSSRGEVTRLAVTDRGMGMPPEVLDRIFDAFYTTKPAGQGMGLGMFLAKLMAEGMGGRLIIRSEVGQGTRAELLIDHDEHTHGPVDGRRGLGGSDADSRGR
jgi:two-component system sensor histidine kinase RegB